MGGWKQDMGAQDIEWPLGLVLRNRPAFERLGLTPNQILTGQEAIECNKAVLGHLFKGKKDKPFPLLCKGDIFKQTDEEADGTATAWFQARASNDTTNLKLEICTARISPHGGAVWGWMGHTAQKGAVIPCFVPDERCLALADAGLWIAKAVPDLAAGRGGVINNPRGGHMISPKEELWFRFNKCWPCRGPSGEEWLGRFVVPQWVIARDVVEAGVLREPAFSGRAGELGDAGGFLASTETFPSGFEHRYLLVPAVYRKCGDTLESTWSADRFDKQAMTPRIWSLLFGPDIIPSTEQVEIKAFSNLADSALEQAKKILRASPGVGDSLLDQYKAITDQLREIAAETAGSSDTTSEVRQGTSNYEVNFTQIKCQLDQRPDFDEEHRCPPVALAAERHVSELQTSDVYPTMADPHGAFRQRDVQFFLDLGARFGENIPGIMHYGRPKCWGLPAGDHDLYFESPVHKLSVLRRSKILRMAKDTTQEKKQKKVMKERQKAITSAGRGYYQTSMQWDSCTPEALEQLSARRQNVLLDRDDAPLEQEKNKRLWFPPRQQTSVRHTFLHVDDETQPAYVGMRYSKSDSELHKSSGHASEEGEDWRTLPGASPRSVPPMPSDLEVAWRLTTCIVEP